MSTSSYVIYCRLLTYIRRYWILLLFGGLASMLYAGIDAWFIYFLKPLLNKGLIEKNRHFLQRAPYLILVIFMLRGIAGFASSYYIAAASSRVIKRLREEVFAHLQKLPAHYYDHTTTGHLLSVLLYSVDQIANASADVLTMAAQSICLICGLLLLMLSISWKLTLLYLGIFPIIIVVVRLSSRRTRRLSLAVQASVAAISHHAEENITGYQTIRLYAGQQAEKNKFAQAVCYNQQQDMQMTMTRALSSMTVQCIAGFAFALTVYIAAADITQAVLSPGGFVAMCSAILALLKPMRDLALVQNKLHRGLGGAETVFAILDTSPEYEIGQHKLQRAKGHIEFVDVTFTHASSKNGVTDLSFCVEPGTTVALVGQSGSGKTTLMNLLLRFYCYHSGCITLDGMPITDYHLKNFRQQFSLVSQHVTLFHDTIAHNIAYGCPTASQADIVAAAQAAYAIEFIQSLPQQFDTMIGENGVLLSGGQRQRIAIARAILKKAPILILDEATSALDSVSERYIQSALRYLFSQHTTLVIAHRLSTIEYANQIVVLERGKMIERGTHATLLAQRGDYYKLYQTQFLHQVAMQ